MKVLCTVKEFIRRLEAGQESHSGGTGSDALVNKRPYVHGATKWTANNDSGRVDRVLNETRDEASYAFVQGANQRAL